MAAPIKVTRGDREVLVGVDVFDVFQGELTVPDTDFSREVTASDNCTCSTYPMTHDRPESDNRNTLQKCIFVSIEKPNNN
jgi:hypothetical protein